VGAGHRIEQRCVGQSFLSPAAHHHLTPPPPAGIGKAYAKKLASQGLNVVLVALDDDLLSEAHAELSEAYPDVTFRKVGVNLGRPGYVEQVKTATADIDVQCCFLNAGYMITGMFEQVPLTAHMENMECNAASAMELTHVLLQRMVSCLCLNVLIERRVCSLFFP
jgi:short-subunit dehydrogenase